jgi:DDE superfamily endonuclease
MLASELLDLYSDYLISSFGLTTATGLATLLQGSVSHDQITRFLSEPAATSAELWQRVKPHVRALQGADGVMIVDDSIAEKPYTDENELICWHYDHIQGRNVKGINFVSALYHRHNVSLPVGFELVSKTEWYSDPKTQEPKRRSAQSKNDLYRSLLRQAVRNQIPFAFVLNDIWFASAENMRFVKHELHKDFVMPLKANRKVALSLIDQRLGRFVSVEMLSLEPDSAVVIYLEGVAFPLSLIKHVYTNADGSQAVVYLVCSDSTLSAAQLLALHQKRWNVEPFHKSLKQNASLTRSPTQTVNSQTNHLFASFCGFIKLELLKRSSGLTQFALRAQIYQQALQSAFQSLRNFRPQSLSA